MKRIITVLLAAIMIFGLIGCFFDNDNPYPYRGEHKELYTAAIYSIPDAVGYMHHGEGACDPEIYVWEKDDYGRTLFSYCEDYSGTIFALVLSQGRDEKGVYFYPEKNYKLTRIDSEYGYESDGDVLKNKTEAFYLESGDKLKEENDWNKPLDKTKCVSYPLTDHKILGEKVYSLDVLECDDILNEYSETLNLPNPESGPHRYNSVLQVDREGKILHEIYGVHRHFDDPDWKKTDEFTYYAITLWVITDKDGNYDKENGVMVMYSKANDPDRFFIYDSSEILEFKNKNGWKYWD